MGPEKHRRKEQSGSRNISAVDNPRGSHRKKKKEQWRDVTRGGRKKGNQNGRRKKGKNWVRGTRLSRNETGTKEKGVKRF